MSPQITVTFREVPAVGKRVIMTCNGQIGTSTVIAQVKTDPQWPGWYGILTQSGTVYAGQVEKDTLHPIIITLNSLHPLEQLVFEMDTGGYTSASILSVAYERGIEIVDHSAFHLVGRYKNYKCLHKSHAKPHEKRKCIHSQKEKDTIKCIRTHLRNLKYRMQVRDEWGKQFVYWTCTDSDACLHRIGIIESTSNLQVTVLHPDCACKMRYVTTDETGNAELYYAMASLLSQDRASADRFLANVRASGWDIHEPLDTDSDEDIF